MEILKEKEMPLLSRKRIVYECDVKAATPSRLDMAKAVAKQQGVDRDLVIIKHIYPKFGDTKFKVIAHIYSDKQVMGQMEPKKLLEKHKAKSDEKEKAKEKPTTDEQIKEEDTEKKVKV
mgnify:CR=1 FL=1